MCVCVCVLCAGFERDPGAVSAEDDICVQNRPNNAKSFYIMKQICFTSNPFQQDMVTHTPDLNHHTLTVCPMITQIWISHTATLQFMSRTQIVGWHLITESMDKMLACTANARCMKPHPIPMWALHHTLHMGEYL